MAWHNRLTNLLRSGRLSRDIEREMEFHVGERADELVRGGMTREAAVREARRRFGNRTIQKERTRDVDVLVWLESAAADVRYALRALRASPGFTLVVILSLALGIGANTAIFTLVNAVVLESLPVKDPEQLLDVTTGGNNSRQGESHGNMSNPMFTNPLWEQIRDGVGKEVFSGVFAYSDTRFDLSNGGLVHYASGNWVSGDFFSTLGVHPAPGGGRLLQRSDDHRGCAPVAVVSDAFARRELGGVSSAVGRTLPLDGHPFDVVGVVSPAFFGMEVGRSVDVYVPLCTLPLFEGPDALDARSRWYLTIVGRPVPGLSEAQVRAALAARSPAIFAATLPPNWRADDWDDYLKMTLGAGPAAGGLSALRDRYQRALYTLMVVVGVVLVIACANIANLLLARAAARQREIAVRLAIGSSRARLVRQLLTESLLLSLIGAGAGLLFARWASRLLVRYLSTGSGNGIWLDLGIDARVLAFTVVVSVVTGILFGVAPAWRAVRVDPQQAMKAGGRGVVHGEGRQRVGKALVVGQVALSLLLVMAAALLLGSFRKLTTLDPGFRRDGVLIARLDFANTGYTGARLLDAQNEILTRARELQGVRSASTSFTTPISGTSWNDVLVVPGYAPSGFLDALALFNQVSDGYFATMGTDLIAGRDFTPADQGRPNPVVVVNESMARHFFGEVNPIGRSFSVQRGDSTGAAMEIVGVVRDTKYQSLTEADQPIVYIPFGAGSDAEKSINLELRSDGSLTALSGAMKDLVASVNPAISLDLTTLQAQVSASLARPRLLAALSGFFGALALLLAVIGLYGTLSYGVARRRNEIGIRLALGAGRERVMRMVVGEAGLLVLVGAIAGVLLALATTRLVSSFLYGYEPTDPAMLILSACVLGAVAMGAAVLPAWRASRLDPTAALREE
jgi:predicted permease